MLIICIFGLCYLVFILFDVLPLWRARDWKLLGLYTGLMLGCWLSVAYFVGSIEIPDPEPLLKSVMGFFAR